MHVSGDVRCSDNGGKSYAFNGRTGTDAHSF